MLELQQRIFKIIDPQTCFEVRQEAIMIFPGFLTRISFEQILTESLLTSGIREYIDFAKELLITSADASPIHNPYLQKLPYTTSVNLTIKAATEYFNASENYLDSNMELAR